MKVSLFVLDPVLRSVYSSVGLPVFDGVPGSDPDCRLVVFGEGPRRPEVDVQVLPARWLRQSTPTSFVRSLHQFGSPFVDLRSFEVPTGTRPAEAAYGPGTSRPVLPTAAFSKRGMEIHRDDPQVAAVFWKIAVQAGGPLGWIRPGFPAICHFAEWHLDGRPGIVTGALASSVDRPGGFVVLEAEDVMQILGYDRRSVPLRLLQDVVPRESAERMLDWAEGIPRLSGGLRTAG